MTNDTSWFLSVLKNMFLLVVTHGFSSSAVLLLKVSLHLCLHTAARPKNCFFNAKLYSPTRGHQSNRLHCNPNCIEIDNQMLIKKQHSTKLDIKERCTPLMLPRQRQNLHFSLFSKYL